MTARVAPYFPKTVGTGNGVLKDFTLGFPFLDAAHLRVFVNGVLKVLGTDYTVLDPTSPENAQLRFAAAVTDTHVIKVARNTPIEKFRGNPVISQIDAVQAFYRMQESLDQRVNLDYYINQTDTLAGTAWSWVATFDGFVEALLTRVADAAIGTGGAVTVEIDGVAVTGLSNTVANSAAIGVNYRDVPTTAQSATTKFKKGQTVTVTPAAAFATTGALAGYLEVQPADLS